MTANTEPVKKSQIARRLYAESPVSENPDSRNCPKTSIGSNLEPQKSTKEGEEALFRCSGGPKMEAPEAALDPFRTVSLGFLLNRGTALPRWTWRRPGPSLGRGKFLRYPAPASRHFTPLYIAYVTKQLSTCCV